MGINLFYDNLSLNENDLNRELERLSEKYKFSIPKDTSELFELTRTNLSLFFGQNFNEIQIGLEELDLGEKERIKFINDLTFNSIRCWHKEFDLSFFMRLGYIIKESIKIKSKLDGETDLKLPYNVKLKTIPRWGTSYIDNVINTKYINIFNTIDRRNETTNSDISKFSLPYISNIYLSMPLEDLESHALFELSVGFSLSYFIYEIIIEKFRSILIRNRLLDNKVKDSYTDDIETVINELRDLYPYFTSIPFVGLRLQAAEMSLTHLLFDIEVNAGNLRQEKPFELQIEMSKKFAKIISEFYSSEQFSDYYEICWILYTRMVDMPLKKGNDHEVEQDKLKKTLMEYRKIILRDYNHDLLTVAPSPSVQSPLYLDIEEIKRKEFAFWIENSEFYDDSIENIKSWDLTDVLIHLVQSRGKINKENYNIPNGSLEEFKNKLIDEECEKYKSNFDESWRKLCLAHGQEGHKEIKLKSSALDYIKVYAMIQNDIAYACQEEYIAQKSI